MKTLIINGSPKGEKGNSHIFAQHFSQGIGHSCEIKCIVKEDYSLLAKAAENYDSIIFIMPLYVHAMPGIVMKLFEQLKSQANQSRSMGFIIQSGFTEPAQSKYAKRYFELLCRRLNYRYLGTVIKGGAAGTYLMPERMNKKLFTSLDEVGKHYGKTGEFSQRIIGVFEKNYHLSKGRARFHQFLFKTGAGNIFWNNMLKQHNAYEERFARPFST